MPDIGHNNPPGHVEFCAETQCDLALWISEHPIVDTEEDARAGKLLVDRAIGALADLETERDSKVRPLNDRVRVINSEYRAPKDDLQTTLKILKNRLDDWRKREHNARIQAAELATLARQEAECKLQEAEAAQQAASEEADHGVVADIAEPILAAERAIEELKRASRVEARAEKAAESVKIGGGFRRALSARTQEILIISDPFKALAAMGLTDKIAEAFLSSARTHRKETGSLPAGISSRQEKSL